MDDVAIARAIHVLAVVWWIGGVAIVTTVILPNARLHGGVAEFEQAERRFALQARIATLLAGLSGFYLIVRFDLWDRFRLLEYWWMHAMVAVWLLFTLMLFVAEPLVLDSWFRRRAAADPQGMLDLVQRFHWFMLTLSVVTILGAVAGSHGLVLFD